MSVATSSPASSSSSAVLFFDAQHTPSSTVILQHGVSIGEKQLSESEHWFLTDQQEQCETMEFYAWASSHENVRIVAESIPVEIMRRLPFDSSSDWHGSIYDFSPKGRADDSIYSSNREIWLKISRGTAIIQFKNIVSNEIISKWLVRANRKFTGHEDDGEGDAKLYCIDSAHKPIAALITLKANGSVMHLSARTVQYENQQFQIIGLGSKKVHLALVWSGDFEDAWKQIQFYSADRYELVAEMADSIKHILSNKLVNFLAQHRLVINSEFVNPISSGPIDSVKVHQIQHSTPFAFGMTFSQLYTKKQPMNAVKTSSSSNSTTALSNEEYESGCDLCLHPAYSLQLLRSFGFEVVHHFAVPYSDLDSIKSTIAKLPDIEGSVVYHYNEFGVVQLEKAKSGGYVVIRAFREKAKRFVFGNAKQTGLVKELEEIENSVQNAKLEFLQNVTLGSVKRMNKKKKQQNQKLAAAGAGEEKKIRETNSSSSTTTNINSSAALIPADYWVVTMPRVDSIGGEIQKMGGFKFPTHENQSWAFHQKPDLFTIQHKFKEIHIATIQTLLKRAQTSCSQRISEISHIPLTEAEKQQWSELGHDFMQYLYDGLLSHKFTATQFFDDYGAYWTRFICQKV